MERLPDSTEAAAAPVDEALLADVGIARLPIPVPFVEAGGPVNVCVIDEADGGFALFDTGVGTEEGTAALLTGLAALGRPVEKLRRIIVSHGHVDHYGNAQLLAEQSGAPVLLHPGDLEKVCGDGRWFKELERHLDYYRRLGVPEDTLQAMLEATKKARTYARQVDRHRVQLLQDGELLHFKQTQATVRHLPGHTPGLVCLHLQAARVLLADDHLLAKVSPNPLLDFSQGEAATKFRALDRYIDSARAVYALELDCVVPGHGVSFRNHRALLDGLLAFYARRQDKLLKALEGGPQTVWALLQTIFPRHDLPRLYLMLSEVIGNLEVLETKGAIRREGEAPFRFLRA